MRFLICMLAVLTAYSPILEAKSKSHQVKKEKLSRNIRFSAADVNGKYQLAGEAVVTVEDEKVLKDLLVLRNHFKDRLREEQRRQ